MPLIQPAIDAVTTAQAAIASLGVLSLDSSQAPVRLARAAVATAQAQLLALRTTTETTTAVITKNAAPGGMIGSAADLTAAVANTGVLAALTQAQGYLGRASVNLGGPPWV